MAETQSQRLGSGQTRPLVNEARNYGPTVSQCFCVAWGLFLNVRLSCVNTLHHKKIGKICHFSLLRAVFPNEIASKFPNILCNESIIVVKKFDFEILTYLYVLRTPKFIYAIFRVMNVCMCVSLCVCMCVCMWVNMIASKRYIRLSSNFVCILQVTIGRTLLILVNIGWIVFLQEYKIILIYYGLWS